jgi:endoglucanase
MGGTGGTGGTANVAGSAGTGGSAGSAGAQAAGGAGGGAEWTGLRVSGTGFVDAQGREFIPRGLGIGEWRNIESYMLDVDTPDVSGVGPTQLRTLLVDAMGEANTDEFFATWEANIVTADDVAKWASWGVNSIRLPINYRSISTAEGAYIEAGFQQIDQFVALCKAQNIYVILDLHAAPGSQNCEQMSDSLDGVARLWSEPASNRPWTIDIWQTIAKRYANEPAVGGYDIFDEPYDTENDGSFSDGIGVLRELYVDITTAIRAVDSHHVLFFEGSNWSSEAIGFEGLEPAWDPQMAWSFHKYWDKNDAASIKPYLDLRTSSNRPVWNGETGENTDDWAKAMISLLESHKIGWNMWTYKKVNCGGGCLASGATEPYTIVAPPNYGKMQQYLEGTGAKPSPADATKIMMALADNAATKKCTYEPGYVKAVFNK